MSMLERLVFLYVRVNLKLHGQTLLIFTHAVRGRGSVLV